MIPQSLRLRGFKGIRSGLGLEEVFLDLEKLPLGLIAIVGPNGAGKTTLMDNLHPFRLQPYKCRKSKDWSPNSFSYYDQCYGTDALKELIFEMGGNRYRSLIMIDAERRKQEAYLFVESGGEWSPLNDGKSRTYDEAAEKVCGSPTLFFSSVFRSQGAKNLSDYTKADIISIVSELLNIDHIKEQGEKARQVVNVLSDRAAKIGTNIEAIDLELELAAAVELREEELRQAVSNIIEEVTSLRQRKEDTWQQLMATEKRQESRKADEDRLQKLEADVATIRQERQQVLAAIEDKKEAARTRRDKVEAEYRGTEESVNAERSTLSQEESAAKANFEARLSAVSTKLTRAEKIFHRADDIRAKVKEEEDIKASIQEQKTAIEEAESTREKLVEKAAQLDALNRQLDENGNRLAMATRDHEQAIKMAEKDLGTARREASKLDGIDCRADGSGWINSSCRFVADAVATRDDIPTLEANLEDAKRVPEEITVLEKEREGIVKAIEPLQPVTDDLPLCEISIKRFRQGVAELETQLAEISKWTVLVPDLERAESEIKELTAEVDSIKKEQVLALRGFDSRRQSLQSRIDAALKKAKDARIEIDHDLERDTADLQRRLSELGNKADSIDSDLFSLRRELAEDLTAIMDGLQRQMNETKAAIEAKDDEVQKLHAELGKVQGQLEAFEKKRQEKAALEQRRARIAAEMTNWRVLAKACSNDGIIALEIDDAGPGISSVANDLLNACYGSRFSVKFATQAEKNDGGLKEAFDILVYDSETGEWVSITEKSGGQVTWLEDSVTRAICLFNIHRSDRSFGTLFSDEKDGALDVQRKVEFLAVKRRAMDLGTHQREFFITQTADLVDMADGRIQLSPGKVEVL